MSVSEFLSSHAVGDLLSGHAMKFVGTFMVLLALAAPFLVPSQYYIVVLFRMFLYLALVASWNVIGYTGYINFGQAAFYGVGAYMFGISVAHLGLPFSAGVLIGGLGAALVALVLGAITMKLSGHYFSIASLLLLIITSVVFTNLSDIGSVLGMPELGAEITLTIPNFLRGTDVTIVFYYLMLIVAVVYVLFSIRLERSEYGYGMIAISEDEEVAQGLGVPTLRLKVLSIVLSGFGAGIVGALYAEYTGYIDPSIFFSLALTFLIVFMGAVGSIGKWYGPLVGVLLFIPADELLTSLASPELARILFGSLFVVVMLLLPRGLGRFFADQLRERFSEPAERQSDSALDD